MKLQFVLDYEETYFFNTYFYFCESWKHFNIQFKEMKDVEVQGKAIFEKVI